MIIFLSLELLLFAPGEATIFIVPSKAGYKVAITSEFVLLEGFKKEFPNNKIGIIFEPHQFSRTKQFFNTFLEALKIADKASFYPIYAARDTKEDQQFSLIENLKNSSIGMVKNLADIQKFVSKFEKNDVIIFCGAGNISTVAHKFLSQNSI